MFCASNTRDERQSHREQRTHWDSHPGWPPRPFCNSFHPDWLRTFFLSTIKHNPGSACHVTTRRCTSPTSASHPWSFLAAAGGPAWKGLVQPPAGDERPKALSEVQPDRGQGPPTRRRRTRLPGASSRSTSCRYFSPASGSLWWGAHLLSPRALQGRPAGSSGCNERGPGARGDECRQNHSGRNSQNPPCPGCCGGIFILHKRRSAPPLLICLQSTIRVPSAQSTDSQEQALHEFTHLNPTGTLEAGTVGPFYRGVN